MPPTKSGRNWFAGGLQLTVIQVQLEAIRIMSQDFDYVQDVLLGTEGIKPCKHAPSPMGELLGAIDSVDRVDDARVLTGIALEQVKEYYESGSTLHKVVVLLEAIQGILEAEVENIQWKLGKCQEALREQD